MPSLYHRIFPVSTYFVTNCFAPLFHGRKAQWDGRMGLCHVMKHFISAIPSHLQSSSGQAWGPSHKISELLPYESFPWAPVLQESPQRGSFLIGLISTGCSFLQGTSSCSGMGSFAVGSAVEFHGLQGTTCITVVFSEGCRGISAVALRAPPAPLPTPPPHPPLVSLTLVSTGLFLSQLLTPLYHSCCAVYFYRVKNNP